IVVCLLRRPPLTATLFRYTTLFRSKDAGMYVCKAGHMAIRKARQGKKNVGKNQKDTYYFDVEKCKVCPFREGCYTAGAKSKTYSVTIKSDEHSKQAKFQETDYF